MTNREAIEILGELKKCYLGGIVDAIDMAIEAVKSQEPRLMTLEEVKMLDRDYYYLESMRSPGKEMQDIIGAYCIVCVTWPSITWARQTMGDSGYGKTWRCWTSKPTDDQRKNTPWTSKPTDDQRKDTPWIEGD